MGCPFLSYSTPYSKPSSQMKKSLSKNFHPLKLSPQSQSSLPQPPKALSSTEDPPPLYSLSLNPPSYTHTSSSMDPQLSPLTIKWTFTQTFLASHPAPWTPAATPTNTPFHFRMVRMSGLHKRSSPTETSYISSHTPKTS